MFQDKQINKDLLGHTSHCYATWTIVLTRVRLTDVLNVTKEILGNAERPPSSWTIQSLV